MQRGLQHSQQPMRSSNRHSMLTHAGDPVAAALEAVGLAGVQVVQRHVAVGALRKLEARVIEGLRARQMVPAQDAADSTQHQGTGSC